MDPISSNRAGRGSTSPPWNKAGPSQRCMLVVQEGCLLARSMGCGRIQSELQHQGGPWRPPVSQEPEPTVWRRLHVLIMSDSRPTGTHPGGLQDQAQPRLLHREPQPVLDTQLLPRTGRVKWLLPPPPQVQMLDSGAGHVIGTCWSPDLVLRYAQTRASPVDEANKYSTGV